MRVYGLWVILALGVLPCGAAESADDPTAVTPQALPADVVDAFERQQTIAHLLADPDYYVWGLTATRWIDGKIHAYYSRWPKKIGFRGWQTHSEIVHAVAEKPEGPFVRSPQPALQPTGRFKDVAVNPAVVHHGGQFLMIAKGDDARHEKPFRIQCAAIADKAEGPYQQVQQPAFDEFQTEDACIWYDAQQKVFRSVVHVLFKPRLVQLVSKDGRVWHKGKPSTFLRKEFRLIDGSLWKPDRTERPFVLPDAKGRPEWLYIAVKKENGSGNLAVKLTRSR